MRLTSNIWDKIGALTPTRDAAVATSGGESYEQKSSGGQVFFAPPPMLSSPAVRPDLTGRKYGDLTIVGQTAHAATASKWREPSWVVRCACGNYAVRRHSKLAKVDPSWPAACPTCTYTRQILARDQSSKGPNAKQLRRDAARLNAIANGDRS